jgi:hypothetical protein
LVAFSATNIPPEALTSHGNSIAKFKDVRGMMRIDASAQANFSNVPSWGDSGPISGHNRGPRSSSGNAMTRGLLGARSNGGGMASLKRDVATQPNVPNVAARVSQRACASDRLMIAHGERLRSISESDEGMRGSDESSGDSGVPDSPLSDDEHFDKADNRFNRLSAPQAKPRGSIFSTKALAPAAVLARKKGPPPAAPTSKEAAVSNSSSPSSGRSPPQRPTPTSLTDKPPLFPMALPTKEWRGTAANTVIKLRPPSVSAPKFSRSGGVGQTAHEAAQSAGNKQVFMPRSILPRNSTRPSGQGRHVSVDLESVDAPYKVHKRNATNFISQRNPSTFYTPSISVKRSAPGIRRPLPPTSKGVIDTKPILAGNNGDLRPLDDMILGFKIPFEKFKAEWDQRNSTIGGQKNVCVLTQRQPFVDKPDTVLPFLERPENAGILRPVLGGPQRPKKVSLLKYPIRVAADVKDTCRQLGSACPSANDTRPRWRI